MSVSDGTIVERRIFESAWIGDATRARQNRLERRSPEANPSSGTSGGRSAGPMGRDPRVLCATTFRWIPVFAVIVSAAAGAIAARDEREPPRESSGSRSELRLGGGVLVASQPYPDADPQVIPVPLVEWSRGRWFVEGIRAGLRVPVAPRQRVTVFLSPRFDALDPDDSPALRGMEPRDWSADLGVSWTCGGPRFAVGVTARSDVLGESDGQALELSFDVPRGAGRWQLVPGVEVIGYDGDLVSYYYGVRPEEAVPGRPAYSGDATVHAGVRLLVLRPLAGRWSLRGFARVERLGDEVRDSPIVEDGTTFAALVGLVRRF